MSSLKVKKVAPFTWKVEEHNEDLVKEEQVWIDLKGMHCTCSSRAFKGFNCKHKRKVIEVEKLE